MTTHIKTVIFVFATILGVYVGYSVSHATEIVVASVIAIILQSIVWLVGKKRCNSVGVAPLLVCIVCVGIVLGIVRVQFVKEKNIYHCSQVCQIEAVVLTSPSTRDDVQTFDVALSDSNAMHIRVRAPLYPTYFVGDHLMLIGKVSEPFNKYPHEGDRFFDYQQYLYVHGIGSEMMYPKIVTLRSESSFLSVLKNIKNYFTSRLTYYVDAPVDSLATGILLGNSSMSKELLEVFRVSGLSHIVVLSGFNIAIVVAIFIFLLKPFPSLVRIGVTSVGVVLFVIMVGGEASVVRATLMAFVSLLALSVGRVYVAEQALIISLFCITLYSPQTPLYDTSLHLSFLATAGIVYMSRVWSLIFAKSSFWKDAITTTVSAYIATIPYSMYAFGTVSIYAIISNSIVVPTVPFMMMTSFCVLFFSYISQIVAYAFGGITSLIGFYIIGVARFTYSLPLSSLEVTLSMPAMILFYFLLIICGSGVYVYYVQKKQYETYETKQKEIISDIIPL
jgi:competence protein ComEC